MADSAKATEFVVFMLLLKKVPGELDTGASSYLFSSVVARFALAVVFGASHDINLSRACCHD